MLERTGLTFVWNELRALPFLGKFIVFIFIRPLNVFSEIIKVGTYSFLSLNLPMRLKDNNYKKILDVQSKLKHGFVRRDLKKIRDLSRLLETDVKVKVFS